MKKGGSRLLAAQERRNDEASVERWAIGDRRSLNVRAWRTFRIGLRFCTQVESISRSRCGFDSSMARLHRHIAAATDVNLTRCCYQPVPSFFVSSVGRG